ncbi:urokinase plasminogen activator surface receptor-like isoform X8 [Ctenopharyngodon idella]|uniref:urokinase plasminogen activator surface receptor-like isoform X8 n=1 Tax=Ctenopharyngodon idella TaxID=7959 RepID=UPI00222F5EBF|nr:urokinase plasminogen activator surface receptor-like isoform X8 [Ctenopharyngodon idella]
MDLQISVFLLFILFTAGHSLRCYECISLTGSCAGQKVKTCPGRFSRCLSSTAVDQVDDSSTTIIIKGCAPVCQSASMSIGSSKATISCCDTNECNAQDPPDPTPNRKKCYSCDRQSCTNTLSCSGTEDRCIKATGAYGGQSVVIKGCASKSICDSASLFGVESISCCEGNLCNGAQSVSQSFLFLCCSLLSYFLLH